MRYLIIAAITLLAYAFSAVFASRLRGRATQVRLFDTICLPVVVALGMYFVRHGFSLRQLLPLWTCALLLLAFSAQWTTPSIARFSEFSLPLPREARRDTSAFGRLWYAWRDFASEVADFQARVFIALVFLVLLWPFRFFALRNDPFRRVSEPRWLPRPALLDTLDEARRQF